MSGCGLRKEMLTFEPLRMVNVVKQKHVEEVQGLNTFQLSNLDHVYDYYNAVALFYDVKKGVAASHRSTVLSGNCVSVGSHNKGSSSNGHLYEDDAVDIVDDPASKLRNALVELLAHYPVAAGRLHFNELTRRYEVKYEPASTSSMSAGNIDNEDLASYGVPFMVARADTTLSMLGDVTAPQPCLDLLYPDIPKRNHNNLPLAPLVLIQVTTFTCGSFTLALVTNHILTDGYTAAIFMRNLCSIANGAGLASSMDLTNRREVFKPRVPPSPKAWMHPYIRARERAIETPPPATDLPYGNATRFSITTTALEDLRLRASENAEGKKCSRYQALIALLWIIRAKCYAHSGAPPSQELPLRFPINLRGRELPALTRDYMGNGVLQCIVRATMQELCESSLAYVVQKIMSSMVRGVHMQEHVQSEIDYIESLLQNGCVPYMDHAFIGIPSLVNLPFYEADCGWGRPIYCSRPSRQLGGRMIILDDPHSKCWNVLVVLNSQEELDIFHEEITTTCP